MTTFDALSAVTKDAYFTPGRKRLVLVVLTDAESKDFDAARLKATLGSQKDIRTVLVRIGSSRERVFGREGLPEADYRPAPHRRSVASSRRRAGARSARATWTRHRPPCAPTPGATGEYGSGASPTRRRSRPTSCWRRFSPSA